MKLDILTRCPYCAFVRETKSGKLKLVGTRLESPIIVVRCIEPGCGGRYCVYVEFQLTDTILERAIDGELESAEINERHRIGSDLKHSSRESDRECYAWHAQRLAQRISLGGRALTEAGEAAARADLPEPGLPFDSSME